MDCSRVRAHGRNYFLAVSSMVYLKRLVLLLALFTSNAFALGTVATEYWQSNKGKFSSPMEACLSVYPGTTIILNQTALQADCGYRRWDGVNVVSGHMVSKKSEMRCPANSSANGSSCSCNAGYQENAAGNACEAPAPPDPCEDLADACAGSEGKTKRYSMPGYKVGMSIVCQPATDVSGTIALFPNCNKGCMGVVSGSNEFNRKADGKWVTFGSAKGNGSTCDPAIIDDLNAEKDPTYEPQEDPKLAETPDATCMNGQKGSVNGVTVCLPFSASSGVTETETKDNGDGTKTNSKTEVKCENGKCEVTKTSTTTNNTTNNTVSSSSTTTTVDKADYCSKNKTAGVCKDEQGEEEGKGSFGGSCQAGFTCKGDAAMCAMAKEQHKRNCDTLGEDKDPGSFINKAKNGTDGESAKAMQENATQINIPTQLNKSGYGWPRSCPANTRIELGFVNASFEIPFDKLCGPLKIFSDIALAITALSLLVWLVFAGREKAGS